MLIIEANENGLQALPGGVHPLAIHSKGYFMRGYAFRQSEQRFQMEWYVIRCLANEIGIAGNDGGGGYALIYSSTYQTAQAVGKQSIFLLLQRLLQWFILVWRLETVLLEMYCIDYITILE